MTLRRLGIACLALAAAVVPAARADDAKPTSPAIVVRLKSFDGLVGDFKYLAELAGKAEEAKQIDGILQNLPVKNGLAGTGLDTKKPFLFYAVVSPDAISSYAALLVPLADEKAFVEFIAGTLGNFGVAATKGSDGIHTVTIPGAPVEAYFKVIDGYAYITARDKSTLDADRLFTPAKLLGAKDNALASISVRIDQVPDMLKQMALQQLDVRVADVRDRKEANETPAQSKMRTTAVDYVFKQIKGVVRDGGTLDAKLVVDQSKEDIGLDVSFTGKPGSTLANDIASLAERTSLFASTLQGAMQFGVNLTIPAELREIGMKVIKDEFDRGLKNEKDENKRALAQKFFDTLSPIAKAGRIDVGVGIHGPNANGNYTIAFGMAVPDGKAIERLLKEDIVPIIPANERHVLTLDAMKVAGLSAHRVKAKNPESMSASDKKIFGESASGLIAFDKNRVAGALGADPATALKAVLEAGSSKPAPPLSMTMSIARVAPLVDPEKAEAAGKLAKATFADAPAGSDLITVKLEGGPALRFKVSMKALGITFFTKMHELDR